MPTIVLTADIGFAFAVGELVFIRRFGEATALEGKRKEKLQESWLHKEGDGENDEDFHSAATAMPNREDTNSSRYSFVI